MIYIDSKQRSILQSKILNISYPKNLPISQRKQEIFNLINNNQVVIITGEAGSGKTTQLPKICIELGRGVNGLIGHTQPRRLAVRTIANRIAKELKTTIGNFVGYKIRFNEFISNNTIIKLMTDGILLAEIQQDHLLMQYDTIIIDEAHERSLNIDFLLGYLKKLLLIRKDLKLIITSATINSKLFSQYFNNAPFIEISGRLFPIEVRYRPFNKEIKNYNNNQLQAIINAIEELNKESLGDILIFMSSEREIFITANALKKKKLNSTEILPLYAKLSNVKQNRVFHSHISKRRIILATNIAETSITIPGIKYVIDLGMARINRYNYRIKVQQLPIEPISQASANQRKGRCGRISEGICIRLYSQEDFIKRKEFTDPEILRTNLTSVILQMIALKLGNINEFPFIEAPNKRNIMDSIRLLEELGAIFNDVKENNWKLTALGYKIIQFPIEPRLALMIIAAQKYNCVREIIIITSALSIQDPRERPIDKRQESKDMHSRFYDKKSDFLSLIKLWNYLDEQQKLNSLKQFHHICNKEFLNYLLIDEWQEIYRQLYQIAIKKLNIIINNNSASYQEIHTALLTGFLSHIGMKDINKQEFIGANNIRFSIFPDSSLFVKPPKWIIVAELIKTNRLWGRVAAHIEPEWIESIATKKLLKYSYSNPYWDPIQGTVKAIEKITIYDLPIIPARRINYDKIDPTSCRKIFIYQALIKGEWQTQHLFFHENFKLRAEVEKLECKARCHDILVSDETLFKFYDQRISNEVISASHFDYWWKKNNHKTPNLLFLKKEMLIKKNKDIRSINELNYPDFWQYNNFKLRLSYQFNPGADNDGITVHIPLPLLNQIQKNDFEWQVPGLRYELITALIKSLPKSIRRNFVPVSKYAKEFLEHAKPLKSPLLDSLEQELKRMTNVVITHKDWHWELIPNHLKIIFQIVDDKDRKISENRSLEMLKETLKSKTQKILSMLANKIKIEQNRLNTWNFGNMSKYYEQEYNNYKIKFWPALVDKKDSVEIKLFNNQKDQQQAMWCGLRRLLLLNISISTKHFYKKLSNKIKTNFCFIPYHNMTDLLNDCVFCGIDLLINNSGGLVWTEKDFSILHKNISNEIDNTLINIANKVEQIFLKTLDIKNQLQNYTNIIMTSGTTDIQKQLDSLVYRGFITDSGFYRLNDILRYLQAIKKRLEKMILDPYQDNIRMLKMDIIQKAWWKLLDKIPSKYHSEHNIQKVRWMIEELRVNLFAQQLGTPYPISDKRILQAIKQITEL